MNICIFGDSFLPAVGGKEFVMHNLANALVELDHNVVVVAKRVGWHPSGEDRGYELRQYSVPVKGSGKLGLDFCSAILTLTLENLKKNIDVVHCHGVDYSGVRVRYARYIHGFPLVMTPHGMDVQKIPALGYGLRLDKTWDRCISKNLKTADYVTAISQSMHDDLEMIPEEYVVDIPNGIHVKRFAGPKSKYFHEKLNIPLENKIILSVGRNHVKKGYVYGIQAISKLVRTLGSSNVHYVLVGCGMTAHRVTIAECKAEKFVSLIDEAPPEKITQCYKAADIFFSPSIVEGFSLVSIEAMAAGLPLVVTNVPGNADLVRENNCGVIVESMDTEDMARGLYAVLSNDSYRMDIGELSAQCARKYDWSQIAKQYEEVYQRAIYKYKKTRVGKYSSFF